MRRAVLAEAVMESAYGWNRQGRYLYPSGPIRIKRQADGFKYLIWTSHTGVKRTQRFQGLLYMTSETDAD